MHGEGHDGIYKHDGFGTYGTYEAGDNSYRFSGANPNNFVCFGPGATTNGTCPNDNLYRIIGIFDEEAKLIKYDYAYSNFPDKWSTWNVYLNKSVELIWMYMGLIEWTIDRITSEHNTNVFIESSGKINTYVGSSNSSRSVRPVFYLKSNVTLNGSHAGTQEDPLRINV